MAKDKRPILPKKENFGYKPQTAPKSKPPKGGSGESGSSSNKK